MKAHTSQFKENIKKLGRQLDSQITYTLNNEEVVLGNEQLNSITPHYEGDILKSVMKQLDIDSNVDIPVGTEVNYKFGIKTRSGKNLLDFSNAIGGTNSGVSAVINSDGTFTANGTSTSASVNIWFIGNYTSTTTLFTLTPGTYYIKDINLYSYDGTTHNSLRPGVRTLTSNFNVSGVRFPTEVSGTAHSNKIYYPQVEKGDTATEYEKGGSVYDYVDYGNYIVHSTEKQEDTRSYKIVCYDKMLYAMKNYESLDVEYPITIKNYLSTLCTKIGLTLKDTNFVNYDKEIVNELYLDSEGKSLGYTYRDVLDEIAGATASTICINEDDELEVRYIKDYKLPSGYTEVDYINADDNRQYIDSGLSLGSNFKIDLTFSLDAYSNSEQPIISTWISGINYWNLFVRPINNNNQLDLYVKAHYTARANGLVLNEKNNISIERNENNWSLSLDNDKREFSVSSLSNNSTTLKIFRRGDLNGTIFGKIYSLKIYNDNILIRDFIPALRNSDNKVGLYDIVNDVFYVNQGTGDFTYGEVVNESVDLIDEEYLKDINVNFGKKYGPVNSIVFSRSAESDNIYRQDEDSVEENGLHEIKIKDNQILNGNNRDEFIDGVFNQLNGFEYYANDYSSTGIAYYDLCDRYNVKIDDNIYSCIMINDELNVTQGLEEQIHTDIPENSETDYKKADKTDRRINETWIIANKQEGYIQALTSRTATLEENTYTITQVNDLIQNAESGITNTFSEAGGNNIFRNTGLWFENSGEDSQQNPYEFWNGVVVKVKEENASNMNALLLQNNNLVQEQIVPNGFYTISFKYKKLLSLATSKVYINNIEYSLSNSEETEFVQIVEVNSQHINIKFTCSENSGCEVYDLMVNAGQVKLAYSQNQNETTTSTVNISKGITITSSDLDVTFKANADGIRTLDRSNNVITKFTDTGMTTEEATIKSKSSIVGTLWQEVNGQTWITRL